MTPKQLSIFVLLMILLALVSGCVTSAIPVFVTGKLKTADGKCIVIVGDTAYEAEKCTIYDQIAVNETNYLYFIAYKFDSPGTTRIVGVRSP